MVFVVVVFAVAAVPVVFVVVFVSGALVVVLMMAPLVLEVDFWVIATGFVMK